MRPPTAADLRFRQSIEAAVCLSIRVIVAFLGIGGLAFAQAFDPVHLAGLKWRNIGPFRGGRVSAVTGVVGQPDTFYMGLPQGGVWKTTSAGQTWYPVFDAIKETSCVGSVQVAPSDPNIVYAGTGEISGGSYGVGVYRSSDAGRTWSHVGLDDSKLVPSMLVDPHDANVVLAAAVGDMFGASPQRGVYRTTDGGKTWKRALNPGEDSGVVHIAWAYDNPSVVIATTMQRFGVPPKNPPDPKAPTGPELYKSTDEGITWNRLNPTGLPKLEGRACVAVAQGTHSQRMYLIGTFGLFRSDDGGTTWRKMAADDSRIANGQGNYSCGVYVDPKNPDIVYTLATCVYRSIDGGKSFEGFKGAPGGDDPQQFWIDPANGNHILLGGDQGATVSLDAGKSWGSWYNQPTGQVYHVSTDNRFPYWVYATQQDSGCIGTSSRGNLGAITPLDWLAHPGNESGYIVVDPLNPNISYAVGPVAGIIRVTYPSGQWVQVEPDMNPESGLRGGSGQMAFSPTNPHELMVSFQYLMSTLDGGVHWNRLSPDLTNDPDAKTQQEKNRAKFASIRSFSASPVAQGQIWLGTSNGFIWLTRDHGKSWENVSLPKLAGERRGNVFFVEASAHDAGSAYVSIGSTGSSDQKGHVYRTRDYGQSWTEIAKDLTSKQSEGERPSVIRSDTHRSGLLFALASRKLLVSFNDGDSWQPLNLNLPTTQVSDLIIHGNDLVLGTFGRGIWILDDFSPLRQVSAATVAEPAHLFKPSDAIRLRRNLNGDTPFPPEVPHAENPPLGAIIYYSLARKPLGTITLEVIDGHGKIVRHMSSAHVEAYDDPAPPVATYWPEIRNPMPAEIGLNRINWNIRYDTPPAFNHDVGDVMGAIPGDTPAAIEGPLALPGVYTVRLTVDGKSVSQTVTVKNDPRSPASNRDLLLEHQLRMNICAGVQEAWDGYHQAEAVRTAVAAVLGSKPNAEVAKAANVLDGKLAKVAGEISHERRFYGPPQPTSFAGLNGYLLARLDSFDYGDMAPTDYMLATYGSDRTKLKTVCDEWRAIQKKDIVAFNATLKRYNLQPIESPVPPLIDPPAPNRRFLPRPPAKEGVGPAAGIPVQKGT